MHGGWQAPLFDEQSGDVMFEQAHRMDALLLGRKTHDIFANYLPNAPEDISFTNLLNRVPKYVASRTLAEPLVWSGSSVVARDLVDRLNLWLFPVLLGSGKRVFADGTVPTALRLTESHLAERYGDPWSSTRGARCAMDVPWNCRKSPTARGGASQKAGNQAGAR